MKIIIKGKNLELTPEIKNYINQKIGSLERFKENLDGSTVARVEIGITTFHHQKGNIFRAEVNLSIPGGLKVLRAETEKEDLFLAINEVRDELQRKIKKYKGKMIAKQRRGAHILKRLRRFSPLSWFKREFDRSKRKRNEGR